MSKKEWCERYPVHLEYLGDDPLGSSKASIKGHPSPLKKYPKRVTCPKCKKRFKPRVMEAGEYEEFHMFLPAHKKSVAAIKKNEKHSVKTTRKRNSKR